MLKNFLMSLKRYKVAGVLNILGLTFAIVAFYIITSQVWYSVSYNRPLKDSERIYLLSALWNSTVGENCHPQGIWSGERPACRTAQHPVCGTGIGKLHSCSTGGLVHSAKCKVGLSGIRTT